MFLGTRGISSPWVQVQLYLGRCLPAPQPRVPLCTPNPQERDYAGTLRGI